MRSKPSTICPGQQLATSLIQNAISGNRGGSSGGGGGGGGSDLINTLRYGGLFNENTGHGTGAAANGDKPKITVSGAGPGGKNHLHIRWN